MNRCRVFRIRRNARITSGGVKSADRDAGGLPQPAFLNAEASAAGGSWKGSKGCTLSSSRRNRLAHGFLIARRQRTLIGRNVETGVVIQANEILDIVLDVRLVLRQCGLDTRPDALLKYMIRTGQLCVLERLRDHLSDRMRKLAPEIQVKLVGNRQSPERRFDRSGCPDVYLGQAEEQVQDPVDLDAPLEQAKPTEECQLRRRQMLLIGTQQPSEGKACRSCWGDVKLGASRARRASPPRNWPISPPR